MANDPGMVPAACGQPSDGPTEAVTRGGVRLHIRPASSADLDQMADIYSHLTAQDMRFRFKGAVTKLSVENVGDLVDPARGTTSYLAFSGDLAVACATLMHDADHISAEVVLAVRPEWKDRGVSWTLLHDVIARAEAAGLKRISPTELREDREAINLQREMGFVARLRSADPVELSMVKSLNGNGSVPLPENWQQE